jgi:hypothetical protein
MENAYNVFVGNPDGKKPPGRPRRRWKDNIRMNIVLTGFRVWIGFISLLIRPGSCEHGNEPSASIKNGKFLDWLCFSIRSLIYGVT